MSADARFTLDTNVLVYAIDRSAPAEKRLHAGDIVLYREKQLRGSRHTTKPSARYAETGGAHVQPSRA